ncbi:MAG: thymidine kinase [Chloroflexi bacterium]|nr:thymidine kinase [Chloroflexota bacterium]
MNDHVRERDRSRGHIELICGSMFSGKTEELIRRLKRAVIAKQHVQVFSHNLDTRYGVSRVASHNGLNWDAIPVQHAEQILEQLDPKATIVAIDEAQFFDASITRVVNELADRGIRVMIAGLDTDFRGEPFGPMPLLMAEAEQVDKLSAICVVCGAPASRTQRLINGAPARYDDPVILVGASEVYEARCRHCHLVPGREVKAEGQK